MPKNTFLLLVLHLQSFGNPKYVSPLETPSMSDFLGKKSLLGLYATHEQRWRREVQYSSGVCMCLEQKGSRFEPNCVDFL